MNRELLFQYIAAVQSLCDNPSNYSRMVENIGDIARNMHYLLNILRPFQVSCMPELTSPACLCNAY